MKALGLANKISKGKSGIWKEKHYVFFIFKWFLRFIKDYARCGRKKYGIRQYKRHMAHNIARLWFRGLLESAPPPWSLCSDTSESENLTGFLQKGRANGSLVNRHKQGSEANPQKREEDESWTDQHGKPIATRRPWNFLPGSYNFQSCWNGTCLISQTWFWDLCGKCWLVLMKADCQPS